MHYIKTNKKCFTFKPNLPSMLKNHVSFSLFIPLFFIFECSSYQYIFLSRKNFVNE